MDRARSQGQTGNVGETSESEGFDEILLAIARAPARRPPPVDPAAGTLWGSAGRYAIRERLGRGGMGTVYLAEDTLLGRLVALKVLDHEDTEEDASHRARLLREARLAASLEHERVARIYDVGEHEGSAFVAMELVRGETLRDWMAHGRESAEPGALLEIVKGIAEGLAVLHGHGVIHRDLKPENVMLAKGGGLKLLDFGLARLVERQEGGDRPALERVFAGQVTGSAFVGTPGYMAPEQCAAEPVGAAADVFALGVVVHELVTGERPFKATTLLALLGQMSAARSPLAGSAWERFPPGLARLVERMLHRDPASRHADGAAVCRALAETVHPPPPSGAPPAPSAAPPRASRARWTIPLAAIVAATASVPWLRAHPFRRPAAPVALSGMVRLSGGTFTIGRSRPELDAECDHLGALCDRPKLDREQPAHEVTLSPFYLDVH